ncbi:hypothetical protein [Actinoplanes sp. NPDC049118]|uniref:hypothetical protein n=1 Tax=Actinoplanes sp. NPDC049118 TaxID=3155769 RepID=UPI00340A20B0
MAKRKPPKVMLAHRSPNEIEETMSTLLDMGRVTITGYDGAEWLDKIGIDVATDAVSIDVRLAAPPDSEEWGPSVTLTLHADGRFEFSGSIDQPKPSEGDARG